MSRNELLACAVPTSSCEKAAPVEITSSGRGREVGEKSRSKGRTHQCTAHGKSSNNPGVKVEPWILLTAQAVNNDTRTTAHSPVSVWLFFLHLHEMSFK